jgi:proline iminopeptidase
VTEEPSRELYAEIEPFAVHQVAVDGGHRLYVEEVGDPDGIPAIFLHGGPGAGCNPGHRRYFDPSRYRVVLFDQRGAGRSTPAGETRHNTTSDLLGDIELIRDRLGIERWLVFGGSWGATLALLYAQAFPARVTALVLRGAFLARRQDLDWFIGERGARLIYPDGWEAFAGAVPPGQGSILQRAAAALASDDLATRAAVAIAWADYTGAIVTLSLPDALVEAETTPRRLQVPKP